MRAVVVHQRLAATLEELGASIGALALQARRAEFARDHQRRAIAFAGLASSVASTQRLVRKLQARALRGSSRARREFSVVRRP